MISWFLIIIIGLAGLFVVYMLTTYKHKNRRIKISRILLVIVILFLASTIYLVSRANHIDMTTVSGFSKGMGVYGAWLVQSFNNMRSISGYAVAMDWKGGNNSNISNTAGVVKAVNVTNASNVVVTPVATPVSTKNKMVPKPLK